MYENSPPQTQTGKSWISMVFQCVQDKLSRVQSSANWGQFAAGFQKENQREECLMWGPGSKLSALSCIGSSLLEGLTWFAWYFEKDMDGACADF